MLWFVAMGGSLLWVIMNLKSYSCMACTCMSLKPLTGESIVPATANKQDDARVDIHARGFWSRRQSASTVTPVSLWLLCIGIMW